MVVIRRNALHPFHPLSIPHHAAFTRACEALMCENESNSEKTATNKTESNATQPYQKKPAAVPTTFIRNAYLSEKDSEFILTLDLPGVHENNISITDENSRLTIRAERKKGDHVVAKYMRTFALCNKTTNHINIKAFLNHGVLYLKIPKTPKVHTPVLVPCTSNVPEDINDHTKFFHMTLDLPGVKPNDLKVTLTPHQDVDIQAHRKQGGSIVHIHRVLSFARHTIDTSKAELFLNEGVMTLVAPLAEDMSRYPARKVLVTSSEDASVNDIDGDIAEDTGINTVAKNCEQKIETETEKHQQATNDFVQL